MHTIHKYPIKIDDEQVIAVPVDSQPLFVGLDPADKPCIWFEVDAVPDGPTVEKKIFVVGTGGPIPDAATVHVGSFVVKPFVWHVFSD